MFVQNEAGSNRKNYHNEKTLEYQSTKVVSRAYPFPYGFIIGTDAADGCNLDCFVITGQLLETGQVVECEVMALMEQIEDGLADHNVLARLSDEHIEITAEVRTELTEFVLNVFQHIEITAEVRTELTEFVLNVFQHIEITAEVRTELTEFVLNVFQHIEGKRISVDRFLGMEEAEAHVTAGLETA